MGGSPLQDYLQKLDATSLVAGVIATLVTTFLFISKKAPKAIINPDIEKDKEKVVNFCTVADIEDMCNKSKTGNVAYCRCWRSKKFPLCDGSHTQFNKETGDNTGPLVIKKAA